MKFLNSKNLFLERGLEGLKKGEERFKREKNTSRKRSIRSVLNVIHIIHPIRPWRPPKTLQLIIPIIQKLPLKLRINQIVSFEFIIPIKINRHIFLPKHNNNIHIFLFLSYLIRNLQKRI